MMALPASAQSGTVLSENESPENLAQARAAAAERIKCDPIEGQDAKIAAFEAAGGKKWDEVEMGCALKAGSQALDEISLPAGLTEASSTADIEQHLGVLKAHIEYFEVLDKDAAGLYLPVESAADLHVRWTQNRNRSEVILAKIDPILPELTEARILRAAYQLASTLRESTDQEKSAARNAAKADLEIAVAENPEALDGLGQLMLGQILVMLPEILGGDALHGIELLENANALNPDDLSVHRALVAAYIGERETDKALAVLATALEVDPATINPQDYVDDMQFLGGLAQRLEQTEMADRFTESRSAMLTGNPELLERGTAASLRYNGDNPFTGQDPNDLK
ncbi:hypothetical protein M3P21_20070 [Ruegeria sp. 2012CJ41-6]|uniref:Tetratricopeptide repeat protein n=1 Tax=Ruegeria spongiae TaxID=2942209 RepID=A0ABT0Q9G9_9RHOB|nr:tetratricopeptide repeat protein [Ruegeria spongiae]MCL6285823.1 hypothetical protein [Ruegeria spongiae]